MLFVRVSREDEYEGCLVKNVFWGGRFYLCVCGLCTGCLHPHAHETFRGYPVGCVVWVLPCAVERVGVVVVVVCGVGAAVHC